ncbi:MAG TPA: PilZ domain-containing protein [Candidatus Angelobacter sp.]|jgi:CheY-like chemotaxis protein|nr:PilZ domain-containing protein [Candidatus Angelobacter sp.]
MQAPLTALLLCNDTQALQVIDRTFEDYSVSTFFCMNGPTAAVSANQRKFDLLMLDFDEPGATDLIDFRATDVWGYPSVVIAMASDPESMKDVLHKRVHFTLQKPFTPALMANTLKAGYSLIVHEKRTSFRHPVRMQATASYLDGSARLPIENAMVQDISQTGLRLQSDSTVPKDAVVFVDFKLPENQTTISLIGKAMWSDTQGRAGIQFRFVTPLELKNLRDWLTGQSPWDAELEPRSQQASDPTFPKRIQ